jgi:hypothetical protein
LLLTFVPASFGFSLEEQAASSSSETPDRSADQKDQWENPTEEAAKLCAFEMNKKMCYLLRSNGDSCYIRLQINLSEPLVKCMAEQLELVVQQLLRHSAFEQPPSNSKTPGP